jgi:Nucleoside-diphosphate-sugar epimerases
MIARLGMNSPFWKGHRALVVGGAGFGGAHLCEQLLARGACVTVVDRLWPADSYLRLAALDGRVSLVPGDICDAAAMKLLVARIEPETVFLLAAQPIVPISNALPLETAAANVMGTYHMLEACRLSRKTRRLVFASSGAYYGATAASAAIPEDAPPLPAANIYAPTKVAADIAVRCYARIYGMRTVVCRWMNTYGPGDTNFSRIVPVSIRRLMRGERPLVDGTDGTNVLELLHVRDMAEGYLAAAERLDDKGVCGEAFNFGSGAPLSLRDAMVELIRAWNTITGESVPEEPLITGPRVNSIKYLDITKARERLGWSPATALRAGLEETVAWYLAKRDALGL